MDLPVGAPIRGPSHHDGRRGAQLLRLGFRMVFEAQPDLDVVGEAGDGTEAVRLTGRTRPDVVLMDIRMPRTTGIEATEQIASKYPETRVLVLTTFDLTDREREVLIEMARGLSNAEIAQRMYLSESTVKTHVGRILPNGPARPGAGGRVRLRDQAGLPRLNPGRPTWRRQRVMTAAAPSR